MDKELEPFITDLLTRAQGIGAAGRTIAAQNSPQNVLLASHLASASFLMTESAIILRKAISLSTSAPITQQTPHQIPKTHPPSPSTHSLGSKRPRPSISQSISTTTPPPTPKRPRAPEIDERTCTVCLLPLKTNPTTGFDAVLAPVIYKLPCCSATCHAFCLKRMIQARACRKNCPSCQVEFSDDLEENLDEVLAHEAKELTSLRDKVSDALTAIEF